MDFFLKFFFTQEVDFEFSKDDGENGAYVYVPDIAEIADNLKSCFHVKFTLFRKVRKYQRTSLLCSKLISLSMISILFLK